MTSSIFTKYSPEVLLGNFSPLAITDEKLKIIWYNNSFKEIFKLARLKGKSLKELFRFADYTDEIRDFFIEQATYSLPALNKQIQITPLYGDEKKKTLKGYKLEILPVSEQTTSRDENEILRKHYVDFQSELQDILMMMVKENSINNLSEAILLKSIKSADGDFGLIVFLNDSTETKFKYSDPNDIITNKSEVEKTIQTDFKFITKWLEINKHSLTALNQSDNLGYNICLITGCHSILISPCFFDNKLIATLIVGKAKSNFTLESISLIEQFATMLAFAISNITTRELNTALENRLLQAQKLETIGKLSSGMAHDFGNLLSSIFGSVNLLRKRIDQNDSVQKLIDNIENCSVRARDLTKGLLSFGKPTPKRKELVKPHQLLGEIIKIITQTFPKTISLKEDIEENLYDLVGNSTEIYQVLLNLCVNAKEATEGKGTIGISAKNITIDNKNHSYFPLLSQGNYVRFSIEDNGVGIEEKNLTKIFDPYFSTKSKDTGSGLGLYVSYGIIKAHKGFIDVSSKPGMGTTFDVYIPAFQLPKEKKPEPTEKIILLADDEPMLGDLLAELLEMNGYSVIKVFSGKEVLKLLTEEIKVDLAIIDYNMPEMSGLDTIAEIKKLNLNIPIILSSGSMWVENELDLSEYNISSQVQKPYEFETMLATIQKLI